MKGRRGLASAVVLAAVGGGTAALSGTQTWATATARSAVSAVPVAVAGGTAAPLSTAAGVVGLASVGALLATRRAGRTLVGLLLVLAGAAALVATGEFLRAPADSRYTTVGIEGSTLPATPAAAPAAIAVSAWPWLTGAAAVVLLATGLAATATGRTWPVLGRRYEAPRPDTPAPDTPAPDAARPDASGRAPAAEPVAARPASIWDDLDAGRDPTAAGPDERGR